MKMRSQGYGSLVRVLLIALVVSVFSASSVFATSILFHGGDADATSGDDGAVFAHLKSLFGDANVTYMQGDAAAADGSDANGFDAVVISATLSSGTVRNKYEDATVGVMNWEQALMRQRGGEFNLSENGRTQGSQTQIDIVDPSHPLAAGLSGTVTVFNSPQTMSFGRDAVAAGATLVATATIDSTDHAIVAADVGDALLGDGSDGNPAIAPGRRVSFFLENVGFADMTPEGVQLFNAAVNWTASVPEPSSFVLGAMGLIGLLAVCYRRRK